MECPLCFQLYSVSQPFAVKLDCSHVICNICVDRIKSSNGVSCPMCFRITKDPDSIPRCKTIQNMINLLLHPSNRPQNYEDKQIGILVRNFRGNIISLKVNKTNTVLELKEQLKQIESIEVNSQWLIFGGKALINDLTLEECGLTDLSMIYLVVRSFGG